MCVSLDLHVTTFRMAVCIIGDLHVTHLQNGRVYHWGPACNPPSEWPPVPPICSRGQNTRQLSQTNMWREPDTRFSFLFVLKRETRTKQFGVISPCPLSEMKSKVTGVTNSHSRSAFQCVAFTQTEVVFCKVSLFRLGHAYLCLLALGVERGAFSVGSHRDTM